jgi:hypothetical protein
MHQAGDAVDSAAAVVSPSAVVPAVPTPPPVAVPSSKPVAPIEFQKVQVAVASNLDPRKLLAGKRSDDEVAA